MQVVKGMVQVVGVTYRIVRLKRGEYEVIRILDDARVGTFKNGPRVEMTAQAVAPELMREIVRAAIQGAKTSWVGRLTLP